MPDALLRASQAALAAAVALAQTGPAQLQAFAGDIILLADLILVARWGQLSLQNRQVVLRLLRRLRGVLACAQGGKGGRKVSIGLRLDDLRTGAARLEDVFRDLTSDAAAAPNASGDTP